MQKSFEQYEESSVANYENAHVCYCVSESLGISYEEATHRFQDLKRWLWLSNKLHRDKCNGLGNIPKKLFIDSKLQFLDDVWHVFILNTKMYNDFCVDNFGRLIHHYPTTKNQKKIALREELKEQISYIYDNLGEDVVRRWYLWE